MNYLFKWSSVLGLNQKPSISVSSLEVAMFEHPNQRLQQERIGLYRKRKKQVKSFVAFCSFYRTCIHNFAYYSAPLTVLCGKSLPGRVVHSDTTRAAFEILKARMIFAPLLPIPKSGQEADFVVATDASTVGIAGLLLQGDSDGHLRPCAY